ncbi:MAG: right-handed parallel beta-helix repeat-containing protein [Tannerellaceae bacterium]
MKHRKRIVWAVLPWCASFCSAANQDTIFVSDYVKSVNTYQNAVAGVQEAINACKSRNADVLVFPQGRIDIWPEGATRKEYFISNTSTENECPSKEKTIGLFFNQIEGLQIKGNGAEIICHGKMITMAFDQCKNITVNDLTFDFERPTGSEVTFVNVTDSGVTARLHPDSRYEIRDKRIALIGEGWKSNLIHSIEHDAEYETWRYSNGNWQALAKADAREIAPGLILFDTPEDFRPKVGNTLTLRDVIRDQVGAFIVECKDIELRNINMRYMHGLGIVSQFVDNITMNNVRCMPDSLSGRILAASADMMHFSGCKGKVKILNCTFEGAHDDPINVHGTNLRLIEKMAPMTYKLRFMHGQSYGFNAFFEGDQVALVNAKTMLRVDSATVKQVVRLSDREVKLLLDKELSAESVIGQDCLENMTWTPELEVRNCSFSRTSTRGLLVTTPRKVVIDHNVFKKTGMSAILIEGDAEGWFESGPVRDVTITNNTFIDCAYQGGPGNAIIALHPSNTVLDSNKPVHRNVKIAGNKFYTFDYPILYAKSADNICFENNEIVRTTQMSSSSGNKAGILLNACRNVRIKDNLFDGEVLGRTIRLENMKKSYVKKDRGFTFAD